MFWAATADESKVFFTTFEALTNNATPGGFYFYEYDDNAPAGKHLTLIAAEKINYEHHSINGISADGSYVYFTAGAPLRPGDPGVSGGGGEGELYVWHEGELRFVATRNESFSNGVIEAWGDLGRYQKDAFRVTPDGKTVVFTSADPANARSTGYEDDVYQEVYVYNYDSNKLRCASCNPSGARPISHAAFNTNVYTDGADEFALTEYMANMYRDRALSENGRYVFFDTADALVPQDTNGRRDVYEYDTLTGQVHLISGGTCDCDSSFVDASADGSNVFFTTHQQLVRSDIDANADLYDARVNGGIPSQNQPPPARCEGDDCQGPAKSAPLFSVPSSLTFAGAGNPGVKASAGSRSRPLTAAQRLARALHACRRQHGRARTECERHVRKRFKASRSVKRASRHAGR
jgi:hypothetical protein